MQLSELLISGLQMLALIVGIAIGATAILLFINYKVGAWEREWRR